MNIEEEQQQFFISKIEYLTRLANIAAITHHIMFYKLMIKTSVLLNG